MILGQTSGVSPSSFSQENLFAMTPSQIAQEVKSVSSETEANVEGLETVVSEEVKKTTSVFSRMCNGIQRKHVISAVVVAAAATAVAAAVHVYGIESLKGYYNALTSSSVATETPSSLTDAPVRA